MKTGVIFDIKEMTVHDGPGVRVTVFFKGCPLRCIWCHNPEGLSGSPQPMKEKGRGVVTCGKIMETKELAAKVMKNADMLQQLKGGVTISGGEPLMQPEFLLAVLKELSSLHRVLQTSGYGSEEAFKKAIQNCELVHFDLKQMCSDAHRKFTGVDNALILRNLGHLKASGKPFTVRMAMIPGVNITRQHFTAVAEALTDARDRVSIELLPYNPFAGAKYPWLDMEYNYTPLQEGEDSPYPTDILESANLSYKIL